MWVWIPDGGYAQMFGYGCAFGCLTGATHRCLSVPRRLDLQLALRTGVWISNRGYTQVFGSATGATHGRLDPQLGLHIGVWIRNRGYTRAFGFLIGATRVFVVPNGRSCKLPSYHTAQRQLRLAVIDCGQLSIAGHCQTSSILKLPAKYAPLLRARELPFGVQVS